MNTGVPNVLHTRASFVQPILARTRLIPPHSLLPAESRKSCIAFTLVALILASSQGMYFPIVVFNSTCRSLWGDISDSTRNDNISAQKPDSQSLSRRLELSDFRPCPE